VNAKWLELLHELVPKNKIVALLLSVGVPDIENQTADARAAARALGLDFHVMNAESEGDFDRAYAQAAGMRIGAMMVHPTAFVFNRRAHLVAVARQYAFPTIYPAREFALAGGLLSYGIDFPDVYRQVGLYTGRVLKGEKVSELPVQQPTKFVLAINLERIPLRFEHSLHGERSSCTLLPRHRQRCARSGAIDAEWCAHRPCAGRPSLC
jgi:ABC-type uncharacterized transport system substrate-binding protein